MKRRFIQDPVTHELVEVSADYVPDARNQDGLLWNDRIYQDLNDPRFTSRSQHREYMDRHGLASTSDFTGNTWRESERKRIERRQGKDPTRIRDIVNAVHQLRGQHGTATRKRT